MKLIEKIAEDRPLRYAFAGIAVLLMFRDGDELGRPASMFPRQGCAGITAQRKIPLLSACAELRSGHSMFP
jgi:hypothetical protein